jgi:hypothetical protein
LRPFNRSPKLGEISQIFLRLSKATVGYRNLHNPSTIIDKEVTVLRLLAVLLPMTVFVSVPYWWPAVQSLIEAGLR